MCASKQNWYECCEKHCSVIIKLIPFCWTEICGDLFFCFFSGWGWVVIKDRFSTTILKNKKKRLLHIPCNSWNLKIIFPCKSYTWDSIMSKHVHFRSVYIIPSSHHPQSTYVHLHTVSWINCCIIVPQPSPQRSKMEHNSEAFLLLVEIEMHGGPKKMYQPDIFKWWWEGARVWCRVLKHSSVIQNSSICKLFW